ncbi:MAG: rhodanese-like domain-containing protein [Steroidobacteraceae bacterium]
MHRRKLVGIAARALALVAVGACVASLSAAGTVPVTQQVLLARLKSRDSSLVVLDVRTPSEFAAGHVPGALNIPHDQIEARIGELESARNREIVVYCRSGRRSAIALDILHSRGFARLSHLEGDWQAWEAANRPSEQSAPPVSRDRSRSAPPPDRKALPPAAGPQPLG